MTLLGECEALERDAERVSAAVRVGDDSLVPAFVERYQALLAQVQTRGPAAIDAATAEAIRRLVALDRRLITLLRVRLTETQRTLATLANLRQTLAAYRGGPGIRGAYVERLA